MKKIVLFISLLLPVLAVAESPCNPQPITEKGAVKGVDVLGYKFDAPLTAAINFEEDLSGMNVMFWIDMNEIRNIQKRIVESNIPASNCRHRYHNNQDYSMGVEGGIAKGSSTIRYQKWACETISYPCVHGWKPKICKKEVKTKIFTHVEHLNFILSPALNSEEDSVEIAISGKKNGAMKFKMEDYVDQELYRNIKNYMKISDVSFRVNEKGRIGLAILADSKELRPNTACSIYERLSSNKENKALSKGVLGLTKMAVDAVK